jgi:GTPase involved in cell partitioning and DNA repair
MCYNHRQHAAPSGGSGGDGGNVIFYVDDNFNTLFGFRGRWAQALAVD